MLDDEPMRLSTPRWVDALWVASVAIPAALASYVYLGPIATAIVGGSLALAYGSWLATTYQRPASRRVIPSCVVTIVLLVVQAWEQWTRGYADTLLGLFPDELASPVVFDEAAWFVVFPLSTTVLFLFGVVGVFFHHPIGNYLAWLTFTFAAVVGLSHGGVLLAAAEWRYVPGSYSSVPLVALATVGMWQLVTYRVDGTQP